MEAAEVDPADGGAALGTDYSLMRQDIMAAYTAGCNSAGAEPYEPFVSYLGEANEDGIELVLRGNDERNFTNRVDDQCLEVICRALHAYAAYIYHIDLQYNHITDEGTACLADIIARAQGLVTLNLRGNDIEFEGAKLLADALKGCPDLEVLNLHGNRIGTRGARCIAELLGSHERLVSMNIGSNSIGHDGVTTVLWMLSNNQSLEELNIENPINKTICHATADHYGKMFATNVGLLKISMRKHQLRDDGCAIMMENLLANTTLRVLDLDANEITPKGCEAIAKYLQSEQCPLQSLHLASNKVGDFGAEALAGAIQVNSSLVHLDLSKNNINDLGLTLLAQSLEANQTLMSFKVFWNHFGQDSLTCFQHLFHLKRGRLWLPDFTIYFVDDHWEIAYVEQGAEADAAINVSLHVAK